MATVLENDAFGYLSPAHIVTNLLVELKRDHFDGQGNLAISNRLDFAIRALCDRQNLYTIDPALTCKSDRISLNATSSEFSQGGSDEDSDDVIDNDCPEETKETTPKTYLTAAKVDAKHPHLKFTRRHSQMPNQWMYEYSHLGKNQRHVDDIIVHKHRSQSTSSQQNQFRSLQCVEAGIVKQQPAFERAEELGFNIWEMVEQIGRKDVLPDLTFYLIKQCPEMPQFLNQNIDEAKLVKFLQKIQSGYRPEIQYHNDLHGTDCMQMTYYQLTTGNIIEKAKLDSLDLLATLVGAACHDFDHDGLNNAYHQNSFTQRAIRYHNQAIQESYHAAQAMQILMQPESNFLQKVPSEVLKIFQERFVGVILATDMAKHMEDLETLKNRMDQLGIASDKNNGHLFVTQVEGKEQFDQQQQLLQTVVHAGDFSTSIRDFHVTRQWTYLLFEEFFHQGDLERSEGVPISFLCDRKTTNIPKTQPGFISFIVQPLFSSLYQLSPELKHILDKITENKKSWESYQESEIDKKVYELKPAIESNLVSEQKTLAPLHEFIVDKI